MTVKILLFQTNWVSITMLLMVTLPNVKCI
jgi:hypothetical protein